MMSSSRAATKKNPKQQPQTPASIRNSAKTRPKIENISTVERSYPLKDNLKKLEISFPENVSFKIVEKASKLKKQAQSESNGRIRENNNMPAKQVRNPTNSKTKNVANSSDLYSSTSKASAFTAVPRKIVQLFKTNKHPLSIPVAQHIQNRLIFALISR